MYFSTKSYLKNTHNHITKHALKHINTPPPPPHSINVKRIHKKQWREDQKASDYISSGTIHAMLPLQYIYIYKLIHL